jgi:hypothetical protein
MQTLPLIGLILLAVATPDIPSPAARTPAWVEQKVREWQPTAKERRWESIGWAQDLRDARRLARAHSRPVFLFTHDGRLNIGRC